MTIEHIDGTYTAQAPISHGSDEDFGMEQRLRTLEFTVRENGDTYFEDVPVISGNSLRGYLRDLLAEHYLTAISTDEDPVEVSDTLSNSFYSGGSLERGSGPGKIKRRLIHDIRDHVPPLSLLGTAIGSQMIEGRVDIGMLVPIASETAAYTGVESDHRVFEFVEETFYTRSDDREGGRQEDEDVQQMRFKVQYLAPGTEFEHTLTLKTGTTDLERACLGQAFALFRKRPILGGLAARGHGTVDFDYGGGLPDPDPYQKFLADNRDELREFIEDLDEKVS